MTKDERAELLKVATLLDLPQSLVKEVIGFADDARAARLVADLGPLPAGWTLGDPLRVGDRVVFTGCDPNLRAALGTRGRQLGVRVMSSVSGKTTMLVSDGTFSGTKAKEAAARAIRVAHPDTYSILLDHLQPPLPRRDTSAR